MESELELLEEIISGYIKENLSGLSADLDDLKTSRPMNTEQTRAIIWYTFRQFGKLGDKRFDDAYKILMGMEISIDDNMGPTDEIMAKLLGLAKGNTKLIFPIEEIQHVVLAGNTGNRFDGLSLMESNILSYIEGNKQGSLEDIIRFRDIMLYYCIRWDSLLHEPIDSGADHAVWFCSVLSTSLIRLKIELVDWNIADSDISFFEINHAHTTIPDWFLSNDGIEFLEDNSGDIARMWIREGEYGKSAPEFAKSIMDWQ